MLACALGIVSYKFILTSYNQTYIYITLYIVPIMLVLNIIH